MTSILHLLLQLLLLCSVDAKKKRVKSGTRYNIHDAVQVVVNKVGPFNNPSETYRYYSFPFCKDHHQDEDEEKLFDRKGGEMHKLRLGESMTGDRRVSSPYEINFQTPIEWRKLCQKTLSKDEVERFREAILNNFFFEFYIEDLPMWGYFGEVDDSNLFDHSQQKIYMYPHLHFKIGYNKASNQIVTASVYTLNNFKLDITNVSDATDVEFSYSVEFEESSLQHKDRFTKYTDSAFYPHKIQVHWLSIFNSIVLVMLLVAFLVLILMRVLKQDFVRYMGNGGDVENVGDENELLLPEDESGWKLLHGDVFRCPNHPELFAAVVGNGAQLVASALTVLALSLTNVVSTTYRGQILSATVVCYNLTGFIGGFVAAYVYHILTSANKQSSRNYWMRSLLYTLTIFTVPVGAVFSYVNTVAIGNGSTAAMPFTTILTVLAIQLLVGLPSTIFGNFMGRYYASKVSSSNKSYFPTRTTKIPRQIPQVIWWKGPIVQFFVGGCLPFSAIYIELHYIFASLWGHAVYTLFGILFVSLLLLILVVSFVSVALLYFQLQNEHHEWWWQSVVVGGSTGIFLYLYCFLYFFHRSEMEGLLQGSFFFGYMGVIAYGLWLMLGSVAWFSSFAFVRYIYGRIKSD